MAITTARSDGTATPLRLAGASIMAKTVFVLTGTLVLAASSWIEVPMVPVPMTMQTFAVLLIGALCGWRLALVTILAWLGEAAVGLPVLAPGGAPGIYRFVGPTAGYLVAFPIAAAFVGLLAERGWMRSFIASSAVMLLGHALILSLGAAWLAHLLGWQKAITVGLTPFLLGSVLKSALAAAIVNILHHGRHDTAS